MRYQRFRPRKRPTPGTMNKLERQYQEHLELRRIAGEVVRFRYEPIKFRLADRTFYTPDFVVTFEDHVECHEVKGFWEDDARVKTKVVAELFPEFVFIAVYQKKKQWVYEEF